MFARMVAAIATVACMAVAAPVLAANPYGVWEPENRESRYEFTACGQANHFLCAELIWIQEDKIDARNSKYLNTYLINEAMPVREGVWRGRITLEGFNFDGTLKVISEDRMQLDACALFVICESIKLNRVSN